MGFQSMKDSLHLVKRLCLLASSENWEMQEFCCCPVTDSDKPPQTATTTSLSSLLSTSFTSLEKMGSFSLLGEIVRQK